MTTQQSLCQKFMEKAELVAATVAEVADMDAAVDYAVNLCGEKEACQLQVSGCTEPLSDGAEALCDTKQKKVLAAPGLDKVVYDRLAAQCAENGFECIGSGMREYLAGIDIGFTVADHGIAETGTLVLNSSGEELRLATMVSEYHVCVLPKSRIRDTSFEVESLLTEDMKKAPNYTAFITGPSRTADIERVLALGVHGPLQLHILLLED
ncbi:LutC/YkgG family protein [Pseudodesulfovibrio tunisiensis]|uniref:LutC/YkgG family protein n=1 Tax=Pseudodesulfovibrio tunisiensis TaxID=463192 RepID=UPI001FB23FE4|nr:lactate utilization protein [Pseudodesulfovibrio tunisiensis]